MPHRPARRVSPLVILAMACTGTSGEPSTAPAGIATTLSLVPAPASLDPGTPEAAWTAPEGGARVELSDPADEELVRLARQFEPPAGYRLRLEVTAQPGSETTSFPHRDEAYHLIVGSRSIELSAATHAGLFYGVQTLRQLPVAANGRLPELTIDDRPRFGYRGLHLDVVRHMFPPEFVKRLIDEMARLKLNAFHWHLTDDQGWRVEIDGYPLLTELGAWRRETMVEKNFDPYVGDGRRYGGYYTKREIRDIVRYAAERYVTVIPEIEMPGHATAALAAYPELSCTGGRIDVETTWGVHPDIFCPSEATFDFLEDVLAEVIDLFPGPYVHIGGDEAPKLRWEESALAQDVMRREGLANEEELQSWFVRRIEAVLSSRGRKLIGWDEILEGGLAPGATVMSWRGTSGGVEAALSGHDVIISPNADLYFDHYQGDSRYEPLAIGGLTTLEDVYGFEPVPEELSGRPEARHVLGPQANLWTEYIPTSEHAEYMVFPRLLALAEVAWTPTAARDPESFRRRLPARLAELEQRGVGYRVDPASGLDEDLPTLGGSVTIELDSAGLGRVHYTLDGSDPDPGDPVVESPLEIAATTGGTVVSARRYTSAGLASPLRRATVRRVSPRPSVAGPERGAPGLVASVFPGGFESVGDFDTISPTSREPVAGVGLDRANGLAPVGLGFDGCLRVPRTAVYRFALTSDDGSDLHVGGELVVDHDGLHGATTRSGAIALEAGLHAFRLRFFDAGGARRLELRVRGPDLAEGPIPSSWFVHDAEDASP